MNSAGAANETGSTATNAGNGGVVTITRNIPWSVRRTTARDDNKETEERERERERSHTVENIDI